MFLTVSTNISHSETFSSLQLPLVDAVGTTLRQRVTELLAARQELTRADFGRRIRRGHSWISEFFAGLRTTNDLRLVGKISRVFGVSVGYLLGETDDPLDPGAATVLATWKMLPPADRALLLTVVASFRQRAVPSAPADGTSTAGPSEARARTRTTADEPPKRKR